MRASVAPTDDFVSSFVRRDINRVRFSNSTMHQRFCVKITFHSEICSFRKVDSLRSRHAALRAMTLPTHEFISTSSCRHCNRSEPGELGKRFPRETGSCPGEKQPLVIESWCSNLHTNASLMLFLHDIAVVVERN